MLIGVPKETWPGERRVALVPTIVKKLKAAGFEVTVESGAGVAAGFPDAAFEEAGASVAQSREWLLGSADVVLRVRKPGADEVGLLKSGAVHVSYLDPFNERSLVDKLAAQGVTAVSMEMIPRTTRAQKMDALSSQANLAGYVTVIQAAVHSPKILPMMMTPAGTIKPARVFIIGAGVAGLQAIATAKRLGARVKPSIPGRWWPSRCSRWAPSSSRSTWAKPARPSDGYAKELTPEQIEKQKEGQKRIIAQSDIVITTAQVFGRKPPMIVSADMVRACSRAA